MNKLFSLTLLALFLLGCKKDQPKIDRPLVVADLVGSYTTALNAQVAAPQMYTSTGIITDKAQIESVIKLIGGNNILFDNDKTDIMPNVLNLNIKTNGDAEVGLQTNLSGTINQSTFTGKLQIVANDELIVSKQKPDTTFLFFYKLPALIIEKPIPPSNIFLPAGSSTGYPDGGLLVSTKRIRLVIKNKELYLPMLIYSRLLQTTFSKETFWVDKYYSYNLPNPDIKSQLTADDKIVLQQVLIKLVKK